MKRVLETNEKIAVKATKVFGSMWAFWVCVAWALLPIAPTLAGYKDVILYVSAGIVQLAALPLIMVGSNVLNRASEARAQQDHETIMSEMKYLRHMHKDLMDEVKILRQVDERLTEIERRLGGE